LPELLGLLCDQFSFAQFEDANAELERIDAFSQEAPEVLRVRVSISRELIPIRPSEFQIRIHERKSVGA
jgi:hypothetical protein